MTSLFPSAVQTKWTVSAAWLNRRHDCTMHGITTRCGARCCSTKSYWPPSAYTADNRARGAQDRWVANGVALRNELYACGNLGPLGCTLQPKDKPITCLLHPLKLNASYKVVSSNWVTLQKGVCRGNHGNGPPLYESLASNLINLFGMDDYMRARTDLRNGRDSYFIITPRLQYEYGVEKKLEGNNAKPKPRTSY